jgi:hypothetical protein
MNTQTNGNKGNGDTPEHDYKATIALAKRYYREVHDMSHDDAKAKVDVLVKENKLQDDAFYNREIAKEAKRKVELEKRKQREAERAQAEKDAQERAKKARDDAESKKSGKYSIPFEILPVIMNLINSNCRRSVVGGALKDMCGFSKEQIENALNDLMPERAKTGRGASNDDNFNAYCAEAKRTEDEMKAFINAQGSDNFIKFTPHLLKRGAFFNAIHDKYSN